MDLKTVGIIFRKEVVDILRDRKTVIFMIALPIFVMPLLSAGITRLAMRERERTQEMRLKVETTPPERERWIHFLEARLQPLEESLDRMVSVFGNSVSDPLKAIARDLGMSRLAVFTHLQDDPKVRSHPRFAELRDAIAPAVQAAVQLLQRAGDKEGAPATLAEIGIKSANDPAVKEMQRVLGLIGSIASIDYVAPDQVASLPATKPAAPESEYSEAVRADAELRRAADAITSGRIEALLRVPKVLDETLIQRDDEVDVGLFYDSTIPLSDVAQDRIRAAIDESRVVVLDARLAREQMPKSFVTPVTLQATNLAPKQKEILKAIGGFLPYILILMCFLGGNFPAVDLGAGEKERLTLETLLVTPATRFEIAAAKFGVVFLGACIASVLATLSMAYTFQSGLMSSKLAAALDIRPSPLAIALTLALIAPTAAVFAAILLSLSIYARSFKEAQSYMMPVQFLIIIPAAASLIPDLRLDMKTAWIPVLNVALGLREVLTLGDATPQWLELGIIFVSASLLATAALVFCAKWFDREQVLFRT